MSRLTSLAEGLPVDTKAMGPLYFRDLGKSMLITNDWGHYLVLDHPDFKKFAAGKMTEKDALWSELQTRGFLRSSMDFKELAGRYVRKNSFHWQAGPSLHMIVVTLRCNQKCHYCHSSVVHPSRTDTDMDLETAKKTVDFIFATPNPTICIEFQGGEPLLNWPIVKFITLYAQKKAKATKRRLLISLVSNMTLMTDERLAFFMDNYVALCTSLDGPAELHNKNRPFLGGGEAQPKVVEWLTKIQRLCQERKDRRYYLPGALMTTTRFSLDYGPRIVDVYKELGLEQIFLRALSPIGFAKRVWGDIGYTPQEFVKFYADTLDYILELNRKGTPMMERMALLCLTKILKGVDPGFMDLRSPAGAVLGCLAYNYNGEIFVSDEGRMVDHQGDPLFRVGSVLKDEWADVIGHPTTRACAASSTLDNQPMCSQCAYKPYCGVCPVFHYEMQRSVAGQMPSSPWCHAHMGIFDVLFERLGDPKSRRIFESWMERDQCKWEESEGLEPDYELAAAASKRGKGKSA